MPRVLINGEHRKVACEPCIRGHRASKCDHHDRILLDVRKPGRPLSECPHPPGAKCSCERLVHTPSHRRTATPISTGPALSSPSRVLQRSRSASRASKARRRSSATTFSPTVLQAAVEQVQSESAGCPEEGGNVDEPEPSVSSAPSTYDTPTAAEEPSTATSENPSSVIDLLNTPTLESHLEVEDWEHLPPPDQPQLPSVHPTGQPQSLGFHAGNALRHAAPSQEQARIQPWPTPQFTPGGASLANYQYRRPSAYDQFAYPNLPDPPLYIQPGPQQPSTFQYPQYTGLPSHHAQPTFGFQMPPAPPINPGLLPPIAPPPLHTCNNSQPCPVHTRPPNKPPCPVHSVAGHQQACPNKPPCPVHGRIHTPPPY